MRQVAGEVHSVAAALHLSYPGVTCALGDETECADPLVKSWNGMIVWIYCTDLVPLPDKGLFLIMDVVQETHS